MSTINRATGYIKFSNLNVSDNYDNPLMHGPLSNLLVLAAREDHR